MRKITLYSTKFLSAIIFMQFVTATSCGFSKDDEDSDRDSIEEDSQSKTSKSSKNQEAKEEKEREIVLMSPV